jgi:hypothetical protein
MEIYNNYNVNNTLTMEDEKKIQYSRKTFNLSFAKYMLIKGSKLHDYFIDLIDNKMFTIQKLADEYKIPKSEICNYSPFFNYIYDRVILNKNVDEYYYNLLVEFIENATQFAEYRYIRDDHQITYIEVLICKCNNTKLILNLFDKFVKKYINNDDFSFLTKIYMNNKQSKNKLIDILLLKIINIPIYSTLNNAIYERLIFLYGIYNSIYAANINLAFGEIVHNYIYANNININNINKLYRLYSNGSNSISQYKKLSDAYDKQFNF